MNKKNNRKGFTIVELVIVIAVIAILATVLVPTFGEVITKADKAKLQSELKNEYTSYTIKAEAAGTIIIKMADGKYYEVVDGNPGPTPTVKAEADVTAYWDAASDKMMHKYEATSGTDATCKHCAATAEHAAPAETTK